MLSGVVFVLNMVITIVFLVKGEVGTEGSRRIYAGDCEKVKSKGLWLHLVINVLSSLLLGASNYTMQVSDI